jgi:Sulfotransferase family
MAEQTESDFRRQSPSPRTQVLFVMGAGRSGSTILGVALGNCDGLFYAGELDKWLPRAGESPLEGEQRARFWAIVRRRMSAAEPLAAPGAHRYLERSSALVRPRSLLVRRRIRPSYRRIMEALYPAIAQTAGARCVVDTSHYPLRARELQSLRGIDLYLVLLAREPRDVVASFARDDVVEPRFRPSTTRAYLLLTYLLAGLVFRRQPRDRRIVVFHEDFIADPHGVLQRLLDLLGSQASPPALDELLTGVPFQANRLIRKDVVSLQTHPRAPRERPASPIDRLLVAALSRLQPRAEPAHAQERRSHLPTG